MGALTAASMVPAAVVMAVTEGAEKLEAVAWKEAQSGREEDMADVFDLRRRLVLLSKQ